MIWMLDAALPRIAENAAVRIWLPRTITSAARNTLMALPFSPEPPARAAVSSIRLSAIRLPSRRLPLCQTRMPPLPEPRLMLAAIDTEQRIVGGAGDGVARHFAVALFQRDGVSAGSEDGAVGNAQALRRIEM